MPFPRPGAFRVPPSTPAPEPAHGASSASPAARALAEFAGRIAGGGRLPGPSTPATPTTDALAAPAADGHAAQALVAALRALTAGALDRAAVRAIVAEVLAESEPARVVHVLRTPTADLELPPASHPMLPTLAKRLALGLHTLITGPAGSGKTHAVMAVAKAMGRPLFVQGPVADSFQLTGFMNAAGQFVETNFSRWAQTPGAILLIDEVDASHPNATFPLNMALANNIAAMAKGDHSVDPSNLVVCTANTWGSGATAEYVGRNKLDAAFIDRFQARLPWGYDEPFETRLAMAKSGVGHRHAAVVPSIRRNAERHGVKAIITPRATIAYCILRAAGVSHAEALDTGVLAGLKDDQRRHLTDGIEDPGPVE
jgi:cobaltochelatase CobS